MKKNIILILSLKILCLFNNLSAQNWLWARSAGSNNNVVATCISADVFGNVYVAGAFSSNSVTFGSTTLTNANFGMNQMFLVKYDNNGNVIWAKGSNGSNQNSSTSIVVDSSGNIVLSGSFFSYSITFGSTTLINAGGKDIFLVKYDNNGNVIWAKNEAGSGDEVGYLDIDAFGNIFMTGYFDSPSITFGATTLVNTSSFNDVFLAKFDSSGNVIWAKSASGVAADLAYSVSADTFGNILITGNFASSSINFSTTTLTNTTGGSNDIFLVKYDSTGNVLWAKSAGGNNNDGSVSTRTDLSGNIYVAGQFASSTISFGSMTLTNVGTGSDIFLVKYDSAGNVLWAHNEGGSFSDNASAISIDISGNVFLCGNFGSPSIAFGSTTLINNGSFDIYLVKYNSNGNALWAGSAGGSILDYAPSMCVDVSGSVYLTGYYNSSSIIFGNDTLTNPSTNFCMLVAKHNGLTSVNELNIVENISTYPNPFIETINLIFTNEKEQEVRFVLYDINGREVKILLDDKVEQGKVQFGFLFGPLVEGIYLLRAEAIDGSVLFSERIVKQ